MKILKIILILICFSTSSIAQQKPKVKQKIYKVKKETHKHCCKKNCYENGKRICVKKQCGIVY
jgi:hypothetical protein